MRSRATVNLLPRNCGAVARFMRHIASAGRPGRIWRSSNLPLIARRRLRYPMNASVDAPATDGHAASPSPAQAIDFLTLLQSLKTQKRTGWVKCGVAGPESIADHMYRMGLMAMLVQGTQYDHHRCVKLALVHDVAEAIVGDITPTCGVSAEDKFRMEADAIAHIQSILGGSGSLAGEEIAQLWREYEQGQTPEARLVKDFDKLEMILQAHEYECSQGKRLQDFFDSTAGKWRTELGRSWAEEICRRRQAALDAGAAAGDGLQQNKVDARD